MKNGALLFHAYGAYVLPLKAEFGWSRTQLSVAFSLMRAETGLLGPYNAENLLAAVATAEALEIESEVIEEVLQPRRWLIEQTTASPLWLRFSPM